MIKHLLRCLTHCSWCHQRQPALPGSTPISAGYHHRFHAVHQCASGNWHYPPGVDASTFNKVSSDLAHTQNLTSSQLTFIEQFQGGLVLNVGRDFRSAADLNPIWHDDALHSCHHANPQAAGWRLVCSNSYDIALDRQWSTLSHT